MNEALIMLSNSKLVNDLKIMFMKKIDLDVSIFKKHVSYFHPSFKISKPDYLLLFTAHSFGSTAFSHQYDSIKISF